ncbi:tRNA (adenosine(37)-N6)-dimethylallyltransferase MiaA [Persicobacter psychrovividus]|uniref:tRNA dimethylallyltransferase n=1 Tax=Persicobacter psychrovividus TaxID=387638 RepID=A0ABN6L8H9_9BACT|nr:tRNA dimethylallyltransferase 2 [Persicobacter psychrovividus]
MRNELITIIGPTASGKTAHAVALAQALNGEIISGDSRQIYRKMDIGTGKDLAEYGDVAHHLIDIRDAGYRYNLSEFQKDFHAAFQQIISRAKLPILCGGTGLYIQTILEGNENTIVSVDAQWRQQSEALTDEALTDLLKGVGAPAYFSDWGHRKRTIRAIEIARFFQQHNAQELPTWVKPLPLEKQLLVGIDIHRDLRRKKITLRLQKRLEEGMIEEVQSLLEQVPAEDLIYYGLEYKLITEHLLGDLSYEEMFMSLEAQIHRFSKRQMTFFRRMEKRGHKILWLSAENGLQENIQNIISHWNKNN